MRDASDRVEYEPSDAEPRLIAWLAVVVGLFLLLSPLTLRLLFPESMHRAVIVGDLSQVPSPRLQIDPAQDLASVRRGEDARLSSYGWVDRERKIVHMPVERGIAVMLERGLPGWPKP